MASKLWAYGKRLTLWGALVSALPILFFPLMFFSILGIAFSVPIGCSVAIYICFRKFYAALFKEDVEVQKGLGVKENEAGELLDAQESESQEEKPRIIIYEDHVKPHGEETEKVEDYGGETQAELEPCAISSGEGEQPHEGLSFIQALKYGGEAPLIEKLVPHEETSGEAQAQVTEKWVPHEEAPHEAQAAQVIEKRVPREEAPEEAQAQVIEKWVPHEESPEDEAQKWDPHEGADTLQWAAQNDQLNPLEEQGPEVETHKDEVREAQLKENGDTHEEGQEEEQEEEDGDTHEEEQEEEEDLQGEREAERGEEGQVQLKKKCDPHGEGSPIEKIAAEEQAPEDEAHCMLKDEEEVYEGEAQLKWDTQEEEGNDRLEGPQEEEGNDRLEGPQEEEGNGRLAFPQEEDNARQDQPAEVETQSSSKKKEEVEVNPSEGEAQSDHINGSAGENIGTKHKRREEHDENNEKLYATDTKHNIREEEDKEQDESNEVEEIPHKRSRHEKSLNLAPPMLYTENTSTEANMVTPEATCHSDQPSMQSNSPVGASNMGVKNDQSVEDNVAVELPITSSSELLVSSASESDKDSKFLSEGAEDTEDAEHLWEEIHAVRNIIGYKEDPHLLYAEEIKALYIFTGIEPPASLKYSGDLDRAKETLKLLKLVYGIK